MANGAFLESLAMSAEMGSLIEIAGLTTKIARVRSGMGKQEEVVTLLASVLADPVSSRKMIFENTTIDAIATGLLADMAEELDPDAYAAAYAQGSATSLEVAAKELLAGAEPT